MLTVLTQTPAFRSEFEGRPAENWASIISTDGAVPPKIQDVFGIR
jgi:hypothetical protein